VSHRVGLVVCPEARIYDHGPEHPLRPDRVLLTWSLIQHLELDRRPNVVRLSCRSADDATIRLVHTAEYIDATKRAGHGEAGDWSRFGYGPGDNPIFDQMHEAAALVVGASVEAARSVWTGETEHAFNAAGGLHHALPARASGFCVYDDPAVAIAWLLQHGAERIAYVDVDVHHGDGVQWTFYDDPRVLTISLHEYGFLFPGTGDLSERGGPNAPRSAVNVPLPAGTGDDAWLGAFRAVVPRSVRAFAPDVLVTQLGCDTHWTDPLAQLQLTTRAYRETATELHALAHHVTGGRWVATGGGGYQWARVVPRAWTLYFAEMCDAELDDELPEGWRAEATSRLGAPTVGPTAGNLPKTFSEPGPARGPGDAGAADVAAAVVALLEQG
jgi:acetoin utilization protein AcuC